MKTAKAAKPAKKPVTPKPMTTRQKLEQVGGIEAICKWVSEGESLNSFCKKFQLVYGTAENWIEEDAERVTNYARARERRADVVFESLDEVSEAAVSAENAVVVAGLRLKSDNIKWKLARMNAKKYGDRQTIDLNAEVTTLTDEQRKAKIEELEAKRKAK